jgi:hypothetical protein
MADFGSSDGYFQIPQTPARKYVIRHNFQAGRKCCGACRGGILVNVVQVIFPARIMEISIDFGHAGSGPDDCTNGCKSGVGGVETRPRLRSQLGEEIRCQKMLLGV